MERYVVLYSGNEGKEFILTDVGMEPFTSTALAEQRIRTFQESGYLSNAKICKLLEI